MQRLSPHEAPIPRPHSDGRQRKAGRPKSRHPSEHVARVCQVTAPDYGVQSRGFASEHTECQIVIFVGVSFYIVNRWIGVLRSNPNFLRRNRDFDGIVDPVAAGSSPVALV